MRAVVRYFHSPDILDLAAYQPEDPDSFGFLLQVLAGPDDGPGEESFDVVVGSPRWLVDQLRDDGMRWGYHHLLTHRYDWERIERFVRDHFEAVEGDTWREVAEQLGRLGRWEFEDYTL